MMSDFKKLLISGGLVLLALACAVLISGMDRWLCALAMSCSFLGDILLSDIKELHKKLSYYFECGAVAFGLAHIFYGMAYFYLLKNETNWLGGFNIGTKLAVIVIISLWLYFVNNCINKKKWNYLLVAAVYILLIGIEFSVVMTYAWETFAVNRNAVGAMLGALFFLVSDCCLGMGRIVGNHRFDKYVWIFYPIGQCLLILCA